MLLDFVTQTLTCFHSDGPAFYSWGCYFCRLCVQSLPEVMRVRSFWYSCAGQHMPDIAGLLSGKRGMASLSRMCALASWTNVPEPQRWAPGFTLLTSSAVLTESNCAGLPCPLEGSLEAVTERMRRGEVSNLDYILLQLNAWGRSPLGLHAPPPTRAPGLEGLHSRSGPASLILARPITMRMPLL
jgi:hypothetical protein